MSDNRYLPVKPGTRGLRKKSRRVRNDCAFCVQGTHELCTDSNISRSAGVPQEALALRIGWACRCRVHNHQ